jgi:molybdenum cofactor cytidylyltransferase
LIVIPALVLAAGKSSRMGRSKAMLPLSSRETFLGRIVRTFLEAGIDDVVVVLGHGADAIAESMKQHAIRARPVINTRYETGQLSSLVAGLEAVERPEVEAVLLTLVDVPLVAAGTVVAVVERFHRTRAPIVRPVQGNRHGHPVLIDRALFNALRAADPVHGAKPIVRAFASPAGDVPSDDEGAFLDIDTPDDYARYIGPSVPDR